LEKSTRFKEGQLCRAALLLYRAVLSLIRKSGFCQLSRAVELEVPRGRTRVPRGTVMRQIRKFQNRLQPLLLTFKAKVNDDFVREKKPMILAHDYTK
jgi:hypothetical protein